MIHSALADDLLRVTTATAQAVMPWSGRGDKEQADHLAVETMRSMLDGLPYRFRILLGEGEKDNAPMLYYGEMLGQGLLDPLYDLVVDPLECTGNFASGLPDSVSAVLAVSEGQAIRFPGTYMEHIIVPASARAALYECGLDRPVAETYRTITRALGESQVTVVVQNRPRHGELIRALRELGAGIALIESGSISAACELLYFPSRARILWGVYGAPEAVILAHLVRAAGGGFLGRIKPHNETTEALARSWELTGVVFRPEDIVKSDGVLSITGIHSSTWLGGVNGDQTESLVVTGNQAYIEHRRGQETTGRKPVAPG
ncbi:MAG: fructose-bisphosphatase class II [Spirochaetales bacterium]|nr:fructose-bisphosphatase class II [Spirochaetales bacterium]